MNLAEDLTVSFPSFFVVICAFNFVSVRVFGEAEYVPSSGGGLSSAEADVDGRFWFSGTGLSKPAGDAGSLIC